MRYARWLLSEGIGPNDLVAFYLLNSPQFMMIWLATTCIGAGPAFINYNLEGKALLHCTDVCQSKVIVVEDEEACVGRIEKSREELEARGTKVVVLSEVLEREIEARPVELVPDSYRAGMEGGFPACLIYTRCVPFLNHPPQTHTNSSSGTTGLPKGCAFTTARMRSLGSHRSPPFDQTPGLDQWYNSMPLYHGTGAITSMTGLLGGVSLALAPRFSVSQFWPDIHSSQSTFFIYVGETARYLLNAPPHPLERSHRLRCGYGNGLRPDVWTKFQSRFNIPQIAEFFNSTEGMFALVNYNTGPFTSACVGHHGLIFRHLMQNVYVPVRIDHETGDIYRSPLTGFAERCSYDTGGEILVAVPNKDAFQGYWRSEAATAKRFAENVFKKGDVWYRSGDALRRDGEGRWYFLDRLGDTFRWKSENVSTAEVAECLGKFPGVAEANVYGVVVPGHEGRAGCVALDLEPGVKELNAYLEEMRGHAVRNLPKYAVPVFLRVVGRSTHIHNHKQNKVPLRKEGVDPKLVGSEAEEGRGDRFFWLDPVRKRYVPFGKGEWVGLERGEVRL